MPTSRRSSAGASIDPASLQRWSLKKLEAELSNRGLSDEGSKQELINRLTAHLTAQTSTAGTAETPPSSAQKAPKEVKKEPKTEPEDEENVAEKTPKRRKSAAPKKGQEILRCPEVVVLEPEREAVAEVARKEIKEEPQEEPVLIEPGESLAEALRRKYSRKRAGEQTDQAPAPTPSTPVESPEIIPVEPDTPALEEEGDAVPSPSPLSQQPPQTSSQETPGVPSENDSEIVADSSENTDVLPSAKAKKPASKPKAKPGRKPVSEPVSEPVTVVVEDVSEGRPKRKRKPTEKIRLSDEQERLQHIFVDTDEERELEDAAKGSLEGEKQRGIESADKVVETAQKSSKRAEISADKPEKKKKKLDQAKSVKETESTQSKKSSLNQQSMASRYSDAAVKDSGGGGAPVTGVPPTQTPLVKDGSHLAKKKRKPSSSSLHEEEEAALSKHKKHKKDKHSDYSTKSQKTGSKTKKSLTAESTKESSNAVASDFISVRKRERRVLYVPPEKRKKLVEASEKIPSLTSEDSAEIVTEIVDLDLDAIFNPPPPPPEEPAPAPRTYVLPEIELRMEEWDVISRDEIEEVKREIVLAKMAERKKRTKGEDPALKWAGRSLLATRIQTKEKEVVKSRKVGPKKKVIDSSDYSTLPSVVAETLLGLPAKGLTASKLQPRPSTGPRRPSAALRQKKSVQFAPTTVDLTSPLREVKVEIDTTTAEKSALDARIEAILGPENRPPKESGKGKVAATPADTDAAFSEAEQLLTEFLRAASDSPGLAEPGVAESASNKVTASGSDQAPSEALESQSGTLSGTEPTGKSIIALETPTIGNDEIAKQIAELAAEATGKTTDSNVPGAITEPKSEEKSPSVDSAREKSAETTASEKSTTTSSSKKSSEREEDEVSSSSSESGSDSDDSDSSDSDSESSRDRDKDRESVETEESSGRGELRVMRIPDRVLDLLPGMMASAAAAAEADKGPRVEQIPGEKRGEEEEEGWGAESPETLLAKALKAAIPIPDREDFAGEHDERADGERKGGEGGGAGEKESPVEEEYEPDGEHHGRYFWRQKQREVDPEPPLDLTEVQLDSYNAHESIKVSGERRSLGEPVIVDGYALMWTGIKASYGFSSGKLAFQVKIVEFMDTSNCVIDERYPHDLRVGWSLENSSYLLGETQHSYGYCSIAQKAENGMFMEWGESYNKDDVVTCCLDFDSGEMSFYKNKQGLGTAFTLDLKGLEGENGEKPVFFPHILTKNCRFEVNFGQLGEWEPLPEEFRFVNEAPEEDRIRGLVPPESKKECTVLMMIGLPGCGKTRFVHRYVKDHPKEDWVVLSADTAMERMRVNGVGRPRCHKGRWDILMGLTAKAVTKMLQLACRKKKNYIIDQTNVFFQSRRRKLGLFKDFSKKALVMVPSDEEFANRRQKQIQETNMEMPAEAMLEMKSMFLLPNLDYEIFDELVFIEPCSGDFDEDLATAQSRVERYNDEGKAWRPWQSGPVGPRRHSGGYHQGWVDKGRGRKGRDQHHHHPHRDGQRDNRRSSGGQDQASVQTPAQPAPVIPPTRELRVDTTETRFGSDSDQTTPSTASPSPAGGVGSFRWSEHKSQQEGKSQRYKSSFSQPGWAKASKTNRGFAGFNAGQAPSYIPPPPALAKVTTLGKEITPELITIEPENLLQGSAGSELELVEEEEEVTEVSVEEELEVIPLEPEAGPDEPVQTIKVVIDEEPVSLEGNGEGKEPELEVIEEERSQENELAEGMEVVQLDQEKPVQELESFSATEESTVLGSGEEQMEAEPVLKPVE